MAIHKKENKGKFVKNNNKFKQIRGYSDEEILGYSDNSPYQNNPYIHINSNNISMAQTGIPLTLIPLDDNYNMLGQYDVEPYSGEYIFNNANSVLEIPKGQRGSNFPGKLKNVEDDFSLINRIKNRGKLSEEQLKKLEANQAYNEAYKKPKLQNSKSKNSVEADKAYEKAYSEPENKSLGKRIKSRGTYDYEADLAKEAENAYELAYKSNKLKNLYGQAKPLARAFLNNPVVKGIGKGLQVVDAINTGIHTKNLYDASQIYDVLQQDNSELGKKYKNLISVSGKFKHGTESVGNFWETGTGQYELETLNQYMAERNKKGSSSAQSFTNKPTLSKASTLNTNTALANDMDFVRSREANIPFLKSKQATSLPVTTKVVTPKSVQPNTVSSSFKSTADEKTVPVTTKVSANKWRQDFSPEELDRQAKENMPKIDDTVNGLDKNAFESSNVFVDPETGRKTIIPKPVTLDFDNPMEAQAIAYRKLKNASMLAPYRGSMQMQTPELYQESVEPYLNNIREQRNAMMQNINPNTSVGQAMLSGLNANLLNTSNNAISEVSRNNAQNTTNYLNQVADIRNKQQSFDYENNRRYSDEVAQLRATQDENDIAYMDALANMNAKRLQAKNRFLTTAIETGLPSDALDIQDDKVTFDVTKVPYQIYNSAKSSEKPVNKRPIKLGDKYYDQYYDTKTGKMRYEPIDIDNKQLGGNAQIYPTQNKSVWDNAKSSVLNYPSIKAIRDLRTNSPVVYNAASILDPTGVSGWEDVQDSWNDGEFTYEDILNPIGALPMLGKIPKGVKLAKKMLMAEKIDKTFKPLHKVAKTIDKITPFSKEVEGVTGKLANKIITSPVYTPFKAGYNTAIDLLNTTNFGIDVAQTVKSAVKKDKK